MSTSEATTLHSLKLAPGQARALAHLVELEARWENLRIDQQLPAGKGSTLKELHQRQKAYEAFFAAMSAYNKAHRPLHLPEQLLNSASRLGAWCGSMRDLYLQIQDNGPALCPQHVLEKAYRCADRAADRMTKDRIGRPGSSGTLPAVIRELDDLARWCEGMAALAT
jgi:hypothetical protein